MDTVTKPLKPREYFAQIDDCLDNGNIGGARIALRELVKLPDPYSQLDNLIKYAIKLRDQELCGEVLQILLEHPTLSIHEKVVRGVRYSDACYEFDARQISVRCLQRLWELSNDNDQDLARIAKGLSDIREYSMAYAIRLLLADREPGNIIRKLEAILLQSRIKRQDGSESLAEVLLNPQDTVHFWELVSSIKHQVGDLPGAIDATQRALACGADEISSRRRLAVLNIVNKNFISAKSEIRKIIAFDNLETRVIRHVANMSAELGDVELALSCAAKQLVGRESDPEAYAYYVQTLIDSKQIAAAEKMLDAICKGTSGLGPIGANMWLWFVKEASRTGRGDIELELAEMGLEKFPSDHDLLAKRKVILARERVLGVVKREPTNEPAKPKSFMARLLNLR